MTNDYISREDAVDAVEFGITLASAINIETGERTELFQRENDELREAVKRIKDIEPADVVSVVRCKDCKHVYCHIYHGWQEPIYTCAHLRSRWNTDNDLEVNPDDFCSYGERKE